VDLAFSQIQWRSRAAPRAACPSGSVMLQRRDGSCRSQSPAARAPVQPAVPWVRHSSGAPACRRRAAGGRCGSAAGRPGRSGRRCRCAPAARCPGPRSWRCRRSHRVVRPQIGFDLGVCPDRENALCTGARSILRKAAFQADHRHGGLEHHRWPRMRRKLRTARACVPGLPSASPSRSATWSEPITTACGKRLATARALARPGGRPGRPGNSPGSGVSSTSGATTLKGDAQAPSSSRR
jgi:hypothetical protein